MGIGRLSLSAMDAKEFGEKLRQIRESMGLSQEEMAQKLGYSSKQSYYRVEKGTSGVPINTIKTILDKLGYEIVYTVRKKAGKK